MRSADLLSSPVDTIAASVRSGEVTAEEMTRASLAAIAERDPSIQAFLTVARDRALEDASAVDAKRKRGDPLGALAGVPIGVKDALATIGIGTTAGSRVLCRGGDLARAYVPPYDATVVARLRSADAIIVGKCNM